MAPLLRRSLGASALLTLLPPTSPGSAASAFAPIPTGVGRRRPPPPPGAAAASAVPAEERVDTVPPPTSFLSPRTFAGQVERLLVSRYGEGTVERVLDSWRYLDMGYEHRRFVGEEQDPPIEDAAVSDCHQHAPSYVPGLRCRQFWDAGEFEWCRRLESAYPRIKEEFERVTSDPGGLSERGNNVWAGALTEDASSYGTGWRTLVLLDRGRWDGVNCGLFPETARAVRECGIPATEVFFASMQPGSDIKLHSDFTNFVLTSHLALVVPENGNNKCRLTVGDETRQWLEGQVSLFDTSIMHSAVNEADDTRYILMFRLWHPDLTDEERGALQTIYDCLEVPELVSDDPGLRFLAEQRVKMARTFPEIGMSGSGGEGKSELGVGGVKRKGKARKGKRRGSGGGGKGFGA